MLHIQNSALPSLQEMFTAKTPPPFTTDSKEHSTTFHQHGEQILRSLLHVRGKKCRAVQWVKVWLERSGRLCAPLYGGEGERLRLNDFFLCSGKRRGWGAGGVICFTSVGCGGGAERKCLHSHAVYTSAVFTLDRVATEALCVWEDCVIKACEPRSHTAVRD